MSPKRFYRLENIITKFFLARFGEKKITFFLDKIFFLGAKFRLLCLWSLRSQNSFFGRIFLTNFFKIFLELIGRKKMQFFLTSYFVILHPKNAENRLFCLWSLRSTIIFFKLVIKLEVQIRWPIQNRMKIDEMVAKSKFAPIQDWTPLENQKNQKILFMKSKVGNVDFCDAYFCLILKKKFWNFSAEKKMQFFLTSYFVILHPVGAKIDFFVYEV